jgi:hypothetical protein
VSVAHLLAQHPEERGRPGQLVHLIDPRTMSNVKRTNLTSSLPLSLQLVHLLPLISETPDEGCELLLLIISFSGLNFGVFLLLSQLLKLLLEPYR